MLTTPLRALIEHWRETYASGAAQSSRLREQERHGSAAYELGKADGRWFCADALEAALIGLPPVEASPSRETHLLVLREMLDEVWAAHSDPKEGDYNGCDKDQCMWCIKTRQALAALSPSVEIPAAPPQDTP